MINKRFLVFRSFNSTNNAGVSSCSSTELLEYWSGVALIALDARVESILSVLPLEVFACVLSINFLNALRWGAVVGVKDTKFSLLWDVMI